jgi:hypothetical protein
MTTLELASLILSAEFALASAVILFLVRRRQRRAEQHQSAQGADLQAQVAGELPSRRESLTKLFQANAQLKGRKLTTTVDQFIAREQAFYDAMLNIYLNKEGKSLGDIPGELRKVLTPWVDLQASANEEVAALGDLRAENAELSEQLNHNKEIIQRLLEEYDATFNKFQQTSEPSSESGPESKQAAETNAEELEFEEDEGSLEDQINDILSSEPPDAEVPLEEEFDSIMDLDEIKPSAEASEDSEPLTFMADDDPEELADLFDAVTEEKKN